MNVKLTPDEFRKLVELAYLGEWMINAQHDPQYQDDTADQVVQRLLAAPHELPDVERDIETGNYYMASEWTEKLYDDHILDYDDHVFWDELAERLAVRDLARERGVPADDIVRDDDLLELKPLEERYHNEFENRGIEHLEISPDF